MGTASNFAIGSCRFPAKREGEIGWLSPFFRNLLRGRSHIQPYQNSFSIGKIADNLARGFGDRAYQRRNGQDLIAGRQLRFLQQVDNLDAVVARQVLLANLFQIAQGLQRPWGLARHVQSKIVLGFRRRTFCVGF